MAGINAENESFNNKQVDDVPSYLRAYLEGSEKPPSMASEYNKAYGEAGIDAKTQTVNDAQAKLNTLNAELQGITAEATQAKLTLEQQAGGKDVTTSFLGRQQAEVDKRAAIKALPLQAQILAQQAIVQNNTNLLNFAQKKLETYFGLVKEDATNTYNYNKSLRDKVFEYADKQEQGLLDKAQKEDDRKYQESRDVLSNAKLFALKALESGQSDLFTQLMNPNITAEEVAIIGGQIRQKAAGAGGSGGGGSTGQLSTIAQAVIENPNLLNSLTPTVKGQVISELQGNGYDTTALGGKPLSDVAIKEINQTDFAITSLNDLKSQIENNLQYIGPIKGLAALNPWSKSRQVQSTIDRVRQTVGKALEGGVLRKEDEEKYKKILATITDTPETAMFKINSLIASITGNLEDYKNLQQSSGKSLDVKSSLNKKGSESSGQTSTGNTFKIKQK